MSLPQNISAIFAPRSIAVLGSPERENGMGDIILGNLVKAGYEGKIFPVNLKAASILGLRSLRKPEEIPAECRPLDLAVICLPHAQCASALRSCAALSVKAALLMKPGFGDEDGSAREAGMAKELLEAAREAGITLLGPDSLGVMHSAGRLNLSPDSAAIPAGHTAFFSRSAAFALAMLSWAKEQGIGFSAFASLGHKSPVNECDMLAYLADDPGTKVITGYLESVANGHRFLHSAGLATRKKPVILCKAGRSPDGARAASSHSGALAGNDMAFDAACKKSGVIRAQSMQELFAMARAFADQPLPKGPGLAVISNAGAPGVIAADACSGSGLALARLSPRTLEGLKKELPPHAALYNPINVTAEAPLRAISLAANAALADSAAHAVLALVCPAPGADLEGFARQMSRLHNPGGKSIFACLMGGEELAGARRLLREARIPCYSFPEEAVQALGAMYRQSQWKEHPLPVEIGYRHDKARARAVIDEAKSHGIFELSDYYSLQIVGAYEIPCLEARLARTSDEAVQIARQLGVPVALKVASPNVAHKTDVGGVALNLSGKDEVRAAFLDITGRARRLRKEAYIAGCRVQAMARKGARETVIGFKRDSSFGPMVFFGLGGIHMQAFGDVSCRLAPLSLEDVHDMVREIRAFPALAGMHGQNPVKFTALEDILLIMSQLALDFPDIQEVECNPVFADEHGAQVGDMRILLTRPRPQTGG